MIDNLGDASWRASRDNRGNPAAPTSDIGDDWRAQRPNEAHTAPPATTGAPGWRPTR
jgi:hypothetical protein